MKKGFVKDSLIFTKYLFEIVCLLIFGLKTWTYRLIQTTLREEDRIKRTRIRKNCTDQKNNFIRLRMLHDLTYNREFITKIEISSSFSVYWIYIYCLIMSMNSNLSIKLDCVVKLVTTISKFFVQIFLMQILPKFSIINFRCFLFYIPSFLWGSFLTSFVSLYGF